MEERIELKFMLNLAEYHQLRRQLSLMMEEDPNVTHDSGYQLSSLYFDDLYDSATYDKADGVEYHKKFRIRWYENGNKRLEYKIKNGNVTMKETLSLDDSLEQALITRDMKVLQLHMDKELIKNIVVKMKLNNLKPVLYVDYFREVFQFQNNNIRLTFDNNIISYSCFNKKQKYKLLQPQEIIMEVKYRKHLPDFLRTIIFQKHYQPIPYSKYLMGWLKLNNWGV